MEYERIYYPESQFGGFTNADGTIAFYVRVNALVQHVSVILDIGCGRGAYAEDPISVRRELRIFKGRCEKVIGIDVDTVNARQNPFIDEFWPIDGPHWPGPDESIDVAVSDNVLEHVEEPRLFFSECQRVIKPGGYLCIRTPNVLSYFGLAARLIPDRFHQEVLRVAQPSRKEEDMFPVCYQCNTKKKLSLMLERYGFEHCVYGYEAEPRYLSFSRVAYFLGVLHQRFAPNVFKVAIFAFGQKGRV